MDPIKVIFQTRDNAVAEKDEKKLAATQLQDIPYASIHGYISCGYLQTTLLHVVDEDTDLKKIAFAKEDYKTHSAYLLYYLVNTVDGWKIYDIVSSIN